MLDEGAPRLALPAGADAAPGDDALVREALAALLARDPDAHDRRMAELAYLANVLVTGASTGGRGFRPAEAARAAVTAVGVGLRHLVEVTGDGPAEVMAREGADTLFRLGWRLLHPGC